MPVVAASYLDHVEDGTLRPDGVILDLEDSVPDRRKAEARVALPQALARLSGGTAERLVRINSLRSPHWQDDVAALQGLELDTVVLSKAEGTEPATLASALDAVGHSQAGILVLVETIRGWLDAEPMLSSSPRVAGVAFGAEDFSADAGVQRDAYDDNPIYAQVLTRLVLLARLHDVDFIDAAWPFLDTDDSQRGLVVEAHLTRKMGADGKLVVHPSHVEKVNEIYTPNPAELARAREILARLDAAELEDGLSVIRFGDRMMDTPERRRLARMLRRFRRFGLDGSS